MSRGGAEDIGAGGEVVHVHAAIPVLDLADPRRGELAARVGHEACGGAHVHPDRLPRGPKGRGDVFVCDASEVTRLRQ